MKKIIILLMAFAGASSVFAAQYNLPGWGTVTLANAYYHFDTKRHLDNTSMPSIALAYNVSPHWAAEAEVGVLNTSQNVTGQRSVHGILYLVDGIYRINPYRHFQPYFIAGLGVLGLKPLVNETEHQAVINAGIGTQFFADKHVALRGEIRDLYSTSAGKNDWLASFGVSFLMDLDKATESCSG